MHSIDAVKEDVKTAVQYKQHKVWSHLVAFGVGVVCGMVLMVLVY